MRRRHLPPPPAIHGIVIDGANVIASGSTRAIERLDMAERWCRTFRPELPVLVFLDGSTVEHCLPAQQRVLRTRCADVTPGRPRYVIVPKQLSADVHALRHALEKQALLLSNDRFRDHEDLRKGVVILQFRLAGDHFEVYPEATWFRPSGGAQRVPLDLLGQPSTRRPEPLR